MNLLSIQNISKAYRLYVGPFKTKDFFALRDVSLQVKAGEILALVGESGSGKTTLGKLVLRLEKPTKGKILFDGVEISNFGKEYTRYVSVVFQDPASSLNPRMSVKETLEEPLIVHGYKGRGERILNVLLEAGLSEEYLHRKTYQLSGGQKQRVAIARATVLGPKLLVADEPTASLDASLRRGILELFLKLKLKGVSVLLITHDIRSVEYVADRVAVLYKGRLLELGTKEQVLKTPLHPYTKYLIQNIPAEHPSQRKTIQAFELETHTEEACPFYPLCEHRMEECRTELKEAFIDGRLVLCNIY
ncbi:oligopeptide/dipeptide ABC transporter ATP-binding protein [Thermocrinis sp.]|uniref:ABC transporter ATP-binding protein n=1 Tax=Thermocrinis sp. TaxID=2024383 RepID=UPI002FDE06E5